MEMDFLSDPDLLAQFLQLQNTGGRNAMLEKQMAQADALRKGGKRQFANAGQATKGNIADILGTVAGFGQQRQLQQQMNQNLGRLEDPSVIIKALRRGGQVPGSEGMGDLSTAMLGMG